MSDGQPSLIFFVFVALLVCQPRLKVEVEVKGKNCQRFFGMVEIKMLEYSFVFFFFRRKGHKWQIYQILI